MAERTESTGSSSGRAQSTASRVFSLLGAWALAFGCAVGWDAFVLPGTSFLPKAGSLGGVLGVLFGGMIMAVVAWNYRFMICRRPGPGGVYSYATEAFGGDHGFICAWFLCLAYMAIVWMDATILVSVARHLFGHDLFSFGFRYTVSGNEVRFGHILLTALAIAAAAAVSCRRPFSRWMQTLLALVFAAGVGACFWAAWRQNGGGFAAMGPLFAEGEGHPVMQVLGVMAMAPWLFVGFEAISNISGDFEFPAKWSFWPMAAALGTSVLVYAMLTAIPALAPPGGAANWAEGLAGLGGAAYPAYEVASAPLGRAGLAVMAATMAGAIFTNLIGNTIAASRMLSAMADDGVVPRWFAHRNAEGASNHAIWAIAAMAVGISALGRTVVEIIVDIAVIGAGIAYAYTSAATFKLAGQTGDRLARATGMAGLVLSVALSLLFVWPSFAAETASMSTESYLVVVMWCLAGMLCFLGVFLRDREQRFGHSVVVWPALLAMILLMSLMWIRQSTHETTARAYDDIISRHAAVCEHDNHSDAPADPHLWREILREKLHAVDRSIVGNSLVQLGLIVLSFALMFVLFASLRRRERDFEREKARAKSYFFSTVSHDIRTPLNAIIGFSEMLKNGLSDPAERDQALDAILVSGKTLLGLINDVLDLSKLESGKMDIVPEPTDCPQLLREVLDAFRIAGNKPGLDLRCNVGRMPTLMLDPQRLRQIVFNIVGNAVKFTDRGHVELRASWEPDPGGESGVFRLAVEDTGCGIGEDDLKRIGSAYVQVAGPARNRNGGTGLGLAICRQLAASMGGTLDVVSRLGKGSTFSIMLPGVRRAPGKAVPPGDRTAAAQPSGRIPRRILLVDDSKINLMVLQAFLKQLGNFSIALAMDGQQALDILRASGDDPFDLVLTDMWMPSLDGKELIRAIRSDPMLASLRVVIVTADVELAPKAGALGFDDILFKPVTADKLAQILHPA